MRPSFLVQESKNKNVIGIEVPDSLLMPCVDENYRINELSDEDLMAAAGS